MPELNGRGTVRYGYVLTSARRIALLYRGIQSRTDLDMLKHAIETQERLEGQKLDWPVVRRLQCMRGAFLSSHLAERCVSGDAFGRRGFCRAFMQMSL